MSFFHNPKSPILTIVHQVIHFIHICEGFLAHKKKYPFEQSFYFQADSFVLQYISASKEKDRYDMDTLRFEGQKPEFVCLYNSFIEKYFGEATGNSIKVLLYLRYCFNMGITINTDEIADACHMDISDVDYAIRYWKKKKFITATDNPDGTRTVRIQTDVSSTNDMPVVKPVPKPTVVARKQVVTPDDELKEEVIPVKVVAPAVDISPAPGISNSQLATISNAYIKAAETFRKKPLSLRDRENLYILTVDYGYDIDMFVELADYVQKHSAPTRCDKTDELVKVAGTWADQGIRTLQDMQDFVNHEIIFEKISSALNRPHLTLQEELIVKTWLDDNSIPAEVIYYACDRTVENSNPTEKGMYPFRYLKAIVDSYVNDRLFTLEAVKEAEEQFKQNKAKKRSVATKTSSYSVDVTKPSNNASFNTQRKNNYGAIVKNNLQKIANMKAEDNGNRS